MFNYKTAFSFLRQINPKYIKLGDGKIVICTQIGTVPLKPLILQALYVPEFRVSLLLVSCFNRAKIRTSFGNGKSIISQGSRSLFTRTINGGIYILDTGSIDTQAALGYTTTTGTDSSESSLWHQRLGHINYEYMKQLLPHISTPNDLCNTCILAKHKRAPHRKIPAQRATNPFELIHSDSCQITTPSLSGALYYLLFIDDYSRWTFVYFLSHKSAINCTKAFQEVLSIIKTRYAPFNVQRFRCDNGTGEYDNQMFRKILTENGITFESSPPHTQNMNGVAERMIQNINTRVRSIMIDANIPMQFWAEIVNTAVYLQARTPTAALQGKTPYETLHQKIANAIEGVDQMKPRINHLRRIGCVAYHRIPDETFKNKTMLKIRTTI